MLRGISPASYMFVPAVISGCSEVFAASVFSSRLQRRILYREKKIGILPVPPN